MKRWWDGNVTPASPEEFEEPFFEKPTIAVDTSHSNGDRVENSTWDSRHLEYAFKVQMTSRIENVDEKSLVLDASEYKEDYLDWYSFVLEENSEHHHTSSPDAILLTPAHLKFTGMPEKRWWNFEDSYVDFGSLEPKKSNIASALLMEFALVHSPDWYVIPHPMNIGTVSKIESLVVIDAFGDETTIEPAGFTAREQNIPGQDKSWNSWNLFSLSKKSLDQVTESIGYNTPYFFLPPLADHALSGSSLEEVKFLRDETANLSWAIEKTYRTLYGEPISGYEHYLFKNKDAQTDTNGNMIDNGNSDKPVKYSLMTTVPWNCIPFIPVHTTKFLSDPANNPPTNAHIELQRGAMIDPKTEEAIRPNSRLLSEVQGSYYIDESEVPRSGVIVSEKCRRIAWHNGRIFLWIGRKKSVGAGEGSSGLKFDSIPSNHEL